MNNRTWKCIRQNGWTYGTRCINVYSIDWFISIYAIINCFPPNSSFKCMLGGIIFPSYAQPNQPTYVYIYVHHHNHSTNMINLLLMNTLLTLLWFQFTGKLSIFQPTSNRRFMLRIDYNSELKLYFILTANLTVNIRADDWYWVEVVSCIHIWMFISKRVTLVDILQQIEVHAILPNPHNDNSTALK